MNMNILVVSVEQPSPFTFPFRIHCYTFFDLCKRAAATRVSAAATNLPFEPRSYIILAPNRIRANELVQVTVSIFRLFYPQLSIRISIKIDTDEIISALEVFRSPGTRLMQLKVPDYTRNATYWFHVEGSIVANSSLLFFNRTKLEFMPQSASFFIQVLQVVSKPVYHQSQIVRFRVIPVLPDLTPLYGSLVSIEVLDASGNLFRRWLNPMTNTGGIIELDFPLSDMVHEGEWTIRATHELFSASKTFRVVEYWRPLWDVNVTVPMRMLDNELAFYGLVSANYTSGKAVRGNATVLIQLREAGDNRWIMPARAQLTKKLYAVDGIASFLITLDDIRRAITGTGASTSLANTELWVNVTYYSWWETDVRTGWAYTQVFSSTPMIRFLGGQVRPFKPNMYFTAYIVVFMPDGSMVQYFGSRRIRLQFFCNENTPSTPAVNLVVPDNGLVTYTYRPSGEGCVTYRLQADYMDETDRILATRNQRIFQYHSYSDTFLQLSTSTLQPRVNEYFVVTVQTNYPTDTIHYVIVSNGNILVADQLRLPNAITSRTFSVAVSRSMFPFAHLIAYFIKDSSEIVSDALTFYTNYTNLNNVHLEVNRGKDLNQDTVEVRGHATPGSYLAVNVIHSDLYKFAAASILREHNIVDELAAYNGQSQRPFVHTWYDNMMDIQRVYVPAPSIGADANTTMNVSGLILFTDANFTKANFYHTCNETLDPARALPCFSMTGRDCYSRAEQCNGIAECVTWVDEMNCPINESDLPQPSRTIDSYNLLYRLWNDGAWMWHSTFVKPDGQIQFRVNLPKLNADWIAGAFAVDEQLGMSLMQQPYYFAGIRRFYMTVEVVEEAVWGEQLGVRLCLFNNWDYWIEALVELKASPDIRVIQIGFGGRTSAYSPRTSVNESVQTLVFLEAGSSKYIYMPVLPKEPGNSSFTICAYSFIGSNCETHEIRVTMNGVPNHYHTATFLDLTSSSALFVNNFKIIVPQKYTIPERRMHRFVPGSQFASLSVVGDCIGPALHSNFPFATTQNVLRMGYGSAESVFFELGYNLNLLLYLYGSPGLSQDVEREGLLYCSVVLQRGFSFFNPALGAFANFRDELDRPSPLATAFALWNLLLTRQPQWNRLIYVDDPTFIRIIDYLASTQQTSSSMGGTNSVDVRLAGSWEVGEVIDRRFAPTSNATDPIDREAHRRIPCAAMVVIAFRSTGRPMPSGIGAERAEVVVASAVQFIARHLLQTNDLFSLMIGTYALSVATDSTSQQKIMLAMQIIDQYRQKGEYIYFANYPIPPPKWELDQAGRRIENPRWEMPNDGYGVASTSFYFLLKRKLGEWNVHMTEAMDVVHWLASQRNHISGFSSTFDSLVALHALREFALSDTNRALYRMAVDEKISSISDWTNRIYVDRGNYSTVTRTTFPPWDVWGDVTMKVEGTGWLLLQLDVRVNVEYPQMQKMPRSPQNLEEVMRSFDIECIPGFRGRNNSIMIMKACGRWVGTMGVEPLSQSGMAVFSIGLPTGYVVLNDDLRRYVMSGQVPNLRFARTWTKTVDFFFDTITTNQTCVQFQAERYYPVANTTQQQVCSAYEYYEPGRYNHSMYNVVSLYTNHICNVCGAYACPYCPDYNDAKRKVSKKTTVSLLVAFTLWLTQRHLARSEGLWQLECTVGNPHLLRTMSADRFEGEAIDRASDRNGTELISAHRSQS
ncbi:hypothetical protein T265_06913 [Opisthorchis viverrini]|uniref:CD109 antigen n=1 Tax=Opisthorchis viverrini TaxID=6198 RepID=A0A074ZIU6_OPIVI|nr:hypothetical protein T265_06913 [Opisthorchis viverrini]KER25677.1 hypothetical protein T265_06913 [Opisthorchis viverrini]